MLYWYEQCETEKYINNNSGKLHLHHIILHEHDQQVSIKQDKYYSVNGVLLN